MTYEIITAHKHNDSMYNVNFESSLNVVQNPSLLLVAGVRPNGNILTSGSFCWSPEHTLATVLNTIHNTLARIFDGRKKELRHVSDGFGALGDGPYIIASRKNSHIITVAPCCLEAVCIDGYHRHGSTTSIVILEFPLQ